MATGIRYAFKRGLIVQGDVWMDMIKSRINTSHTDNKNVGTYYFKKNYSRLLL